MMLAMPQFGSSGRWGCLTSITNQTYLAGVLPSLNHLKLVSNLKFQGWVGKNTAILEWFPKSISGGGTFSCYPWWVNPLSEAGSLDIYTVIHSWICWTEDRRQLTGWQAAKSFGDPSWGSSSSYRNPTSWIPGAIRFMDVEWGHGLGSRNWDHGGVSACRPWLEICRCQPHDPKPWAMIAG